MGNAKNNSMYYLQFIYLLFAEFVKQGTYHISCGQHFCMNQEEQNIFRIDQFLNIKSINFWRTLFADSKQEKQFPPAYLLNQLNSPRFSQICSQVNHKYTLTALQEIFQFNYFLLHIQNNSLLYKPNLQQIEVVNNLYLLLPIDKDIKSMTKKEYQNQRLSQNQSLDSGKHIQKINSRGRPRKQKLLNSQNQSQEEDEITKETIQTIIIKFFNSIEQTDLVFKSSIRKKMIEIYPERNLNKDHDYNPLVQKEKIMKTINSLKIMKQLRQKQVDDNVLASSMQSLANCFQDAAKLFSSEVTFQLYHVLKQVADIVFTSRNEEQKMKLQLRQLGNEMANKKNKHYDYFYFGFKMFSLPKGSKQSDIPKLIKHNPQYRYILKEQYRQAEGPYADFIEQTGSYILRLIENENLKQLNAY